MKANIKWSSLLSEVERTIPTLENLSDYKILLDQFESVDENYRDQNFSHLYLTMWKVALKIGKLNLANSYAKKSLEFLISYKRIPQIKKFIQSLNESGLFKKNADEYLRKRDILLGKKVDLGHSDFHYYFDLMEDHPEHWKEFPEFLKQYLLINEEWSAEQWKLCYEFILIHHFDKDLFLNLMSKCHERKMPKLENKFLEYFQARKIRVRRLSSLVDEVGVSENQKLHLDYDLVAMDLLSGVIEPSAEEQRRVLNSLKYIPEEELKVKGQDMIVAFELLGMEKVVLSLCEQMTKILSDTKQLASIYYVWCQALNNNGEHFKAIDLIDEVLQKEPLYQEERVAFLYLKAEACLKLKKLKMAKELYTEIKKYNPHYRLVGERLKAIETA